MTKIGLRQTLTRAGSGTRKLTDASRLKQDIFPSTTRKVVLHRCFSTIEVEPNLFFVADLFIIGAPASFRSIIGQ